MKTFNEENFIMTNTNAGRVISEFKITKKRMVFDVTDRDDWSLFEHIRQVNKMVTHPNAVKESLKILNIANEDLVDLIVKGKDYGVAGNIIEKTYAIMPVNTETNEVVIEYFDKQRV